MRAFYVRSPEHNIEENREDTAKLLPRMEQKRH